MEINENTFELILKFYTLGYDHAMENIKAVSEIMPDKESLRDKLKDAINKK